MTECVRIQCSGAARRVSRVLLYMLAVMLIGLISIELYLRMVLPPTYGHIPFDRGLKLYSMADAREHPFSTGATNVLRVAVIGDSFAMGAGVQRFTSVGPDLEDFLNLNDGPPPVRVDVYARPTATYQQVDMVRQALADGAKVVILACNLNDAEDWTQAEKLVSYRPDTKEHALPAVARFFAAHSFAARMLFNHVDQRRRERAYLRYYKYLYAPDYSGLQKFRSAVAEIAEMCRTNGAQVVGMLFPLLNLDLRTDVYRPYARMHDAVHGFFNDAGVPFLDLQPVFASADPVRVQNVPGIDPHPNEIGHRLAAEALFNFMLERGIVPADYQPRYKREPHIVKVWKTKMRAYGQPLPEP